jgi:putative flippase GtrA
VSVRQRLKKLIAHPVESTLLQMPRALVTSVLASLLSLGMVLLLVDVLRWLDRYTAFALAYLAGSVLQYALCLTWVFAGAQSRKHAAGFARFMLMSLLALPLAELVIFAATWAHFPTALAVITSQATTFGWNFFSRKLLLFRPRIVPVEAA